MIHPDPKLGELLIAAARQRLDEQVRGIPAPAFKFPAEETIPRRLDGNIVWEHPDDGLSITWPPI